MRLQDAIDQMARGTAPVLDRENQQNSPVSPPQGGKITHHEHKKATERQEKGRGKHRKSQEPAPKPERLTFLQPCPLCFGRLFIAGHGGGFFCTNCQPGIDGHPVEAAGRGTRKARTAVELYPVNHDHQGLGPSDPQPEQVTAQQREFFRAAWPWIKENKAQLIRAGWTMSALVARSKFRWPSGRWGLAWLPVWTRDQLQITINERGSIVFTFRYCGKTVSQTVKP